MLSFGIGTDILKYALRLPASVNNEVKMTPDNDGVVIAACDVALASVSFTRIYKEVFTNYEYDVGTTFGCDLGQLLEVVGVLRNRTVNVVVEKDGGRILVTDGTKTGARRILSPDAVQQYPHVPKIDLEVKEPIPSDMLGGILIAGKLGEGGISLTVQGDTLTARSGDAEFGEVKIPLTGTYQCITSSFSESYIEPIGYMKGEVWFRLGTNAPLMCTSVYEGVEHTYIAAPRFG